MTTADLETLGHGDKAPEPEASTQGPGKAIAGKSPTRIAFERLRKDKIAIICSVVLGFLVLAAVLAPVICRILGIYPGPYPQGVDGSQFVENTMPAMGPPFYPFTWEHPLGLAPRTGYDNLARLLYGLRTSLAIAFIGALLSTLIGVSVGLIAGYARGFLDKSIALVIDLFISFPFILGALALAPIIISRFAADPEKLKWAQIFAIIAVLVVLGWMYLARLIRGEVLSLREREYVQAALVIGVPTRRILFKELLPNLIAPIVVSFSLTLPGFVALEATLSYLGIGLTGVPSLGRTILDAVGYYELYPLYLWAPLITVMVLTVALNLLGDSIRDAFDPKTRR
jgi:peptide/nickel transport system permease protein